MNPIRIATLGVLLLLGSSIAPAATLVVNPSADLYVRQDLPSQVNAAGTQMLTGHIVSGTPEMRSLLTFDLTAIPEGATIESVSLLLRREEDTSSQFSTVTLNLYQVTEVFTPSQTSWTNRATSTPWTTAGGTFDSTVLSSVNAAVRSAADVEWGSTSGFVSAIQSSYDGGGSISLMVKDPDVSGAVRELFRFSTNERGIGFAPELEITYTLAAIPEPSTLALLLGGTGLIVSVGIRRRR